MMERRSLGLALGRGTEVSEFWVPKKRDGDQGISSGPRGGILHLLWQVSQLPRRPRWPDRHWLSV